MDDDQQFCLRWNNHQSTLISVFDTLLENQTLVDCTLAAEGKFLKAHKVVLSACSPYFAALLSQQYDKHPIFILKDVKYQELRAMMDYMYRGEVNISQDQLAALLKAAESLQIKGLSDNRSSGGGGGGGGSGSSQKTADHKHISVPGKLISGGGGGGSGGGLGAGIGSGGFGGYTLEQTKRARVGPSSIDSQDLSCSREGSSSPTSRRRRKIRRRSIENAMSDIHENSNSSQIQIQQSSSIVPTQSNASTIMGGGLSAITAAAAAAAAGMTAATIAGSGSVLASAAAAAAATQQQQHHTSASTSSLSVAASAASASSSANTPGTASAAQTAGNLITTNVTKKTESLSKLGNADGGINIMENVQDDKDEKDAINKKDQQNNHKQHQQQQRLSKLIDTSSTSSAIGKDTEMIIEPKSEYDDDGNDETVEDLTLDDEEMGLEDLDHNAGPSHGGEGSSQGYAQWQVDRSQDEVFMAAQEAQQRDPQVKHDKSEQTDITPDEFELDDCLLESNDIVITQNKDGFVLHVKKLGGNITTSKITAGDEDQVAAAAVAAATVGQQQVHITDVQNVTEVKQQPTLTTLTTSHAIKLPSSECELINLKKVIPTGCTTIAGHHHQQLHHHHHQQQNTTTTIIQPQLHQQDQHTTSLVTTTPTNINTLIGLRGVQIEPKNIHSRIKYSRGKIISPQGANATTTTTTTVQLKPDNTITHHDLPEATKYEISEIDLNNAQASASIISDLVKYAEIDDIELPDGTKIGIGFAPTEITEHMQHTTQTTHHIVDEQSSEQDQHHHHHHQQQHQQQQDQDHQQQQHLQQHHTQSHHHHQHHQQQQHEDTDDFDPIQQDQELSEQVSVHQVDQPTTITKSYTILTTRPMKQEMSTTTTTYELSLSDSSMGQSDDIDSKYICRHCGKKYRWKSTLRRHENVECGGKEPCHPCPHCSYKAKQRGNLGVHVRKHHPDKPQLESKRGRK